MLKVASIALASTACLLAAGYAPGAGLPGLPTQLSSPGLAVKPPVVSFTGDGSGFLGGFNGSPRWDSKAGWVDLGSFTWRTWTGRDARGSGAAWLRSCWRPGCDKHRFTAYHATAHASLPVHGHFTRLAIVVIMNGRPTVDCRRVGYVGQPDNYYAYGPSFHCRP
jgi:hypothetical protein